jgi:hypothetical protein
MKVPASAAATCAPSTSGGSAIEPMVTMIPSTAATMPKAGRPSLIVVTELAICSISA